jgi:hypothetical protein
MPPCFPESLIKDAALYNASRETLWKLRRASQSLSMLQTTLDMKISEQERSIIPASYHVGLNIIPNEVLLRILAFCFPNDASSGSMHWQEYGAEKALKLSLISHRFRDLIYRTSSFWSLIGFEEHAGRKPFTSMQLSRNLNHASRSPLYVIYTDDLKDDISRLSTKCKGLYISSPVNPEETLPRSFPVLECLTCFTWELESGASFRQYLDSAYFPALKKLELLNNLRPPVRLLSGLTSLKVLNGLGINGKSCIASHLLLILKETPNLCHLEYDCIISYDHLVEEERSLSFARKKTVKLPYLVSCDASFTCKVSPGCPPSRDPFKNEDTMSRMSSSIETCLSIMEVVNLHSLTICLEGSGWWGSSRNPQISFDKAFPRSRLSPAVRELSFRVYLTDHLLAETSQMPEMCRSKYICDTLPSLLARFPTVESFTLAARMGSSVECDPLLMLAKDFAKLRSLRVVDHHDLSASSFEELITTIFAMNDVKLEEIVFDPLISNDDRNYMDPSIWTRRLWKNTKGRGSERIICT